MTRSKQANAILTALKKLAKETDLSRLNDLRLIFALERAIARLERHPRLGDHLVFKGGFVLFKTTETERYTHDVDALAIKLARSSVVNMVTQALKVDLFDGVWFGEFESFDLKDQGPYGGYTIRCAFQIGDPPDKESALKKLSRLRIDIGFGDALTIVPPKESMTSIIPSSKPISWSIYPLEYIFAEKLEALFSRGAASSRAKDIYDMPLIFPKCDVEKTVEAITSTFRIRETPLPDSLRTTAEGMDTAVLRRSWGAVDFSKDDVNFEDCWKKLASCLGTVDKVMTTKK